MSVNALLSINSVGGKLQKEDVLPQVTFPVALPPMLTTGKKK